MNGFDSQIRDCDLVDFPTKIITLHCEWFDDRVLASRLDQFFCTHEWI